MSDAFDELMSIVARLRGPDGCPWDREQTFQTLRPHLLEEAYEAADAAAGGEPADLAEELGDLLLQILMLARIAEEDGAFTVDDVCRGISEKLVRRHPHVFGEVEADDAAEVLRNWERIKETERRGDAEASVLGGIPNTLPALLKAYRMGQKTANLGFDWERPEDVGAKLREEIWELEAELDRGAGVGDERVRREVGDVLFSVVNVARHLGVEPESALQDANLKFRTRFAAVEAAACEQGRSVGELSPEELDQLWEAAKTASGS